MEPTTQLHNTCYIILMVFVSDRPSPLDAPLMINKGIIIFLHSGRCTQVCGVHGDHLEVLIPCGLSAKQAFLLLA
jgi:hypothetical protein